MTGQEKLDMLARGSVDMDYVDLINIIQRNGEAVHTRNSLCTRLIHHTCLFNSTPLVSVRRTAWRNALREMEWFLSGSNDIKDLHPDVQKWWEPWTDEDGYIPYNYSIQFRAFAGRNGTLDQIASLIHGITHHPYSRRNLITTWNTQDMQRAMSDPKGITNCHGTIIQAFVSPKDNSLTLDTYQRSADVIVGVPHNWLQYWALLVWLAHRTGRKVGELYWTGGDCHIYADHKEIVSRLGGTTYKEMRAIQTPQLIYRPTSTEFKADDFGLDREYRPIFSESAKMVV